MNLAVLAEQENRHPVEGRQPFATVQDLLEHRRSVRHRAADDFQDIRRRCLPLQRLALLGQQSRVLDGNDGLVSETLQQRDLLIGKRTHLITGSHDATAWSR